MKTKNVSLLIIYLMCVYHLGAKTPYYELVDSAEHHIKKCEWIEAENYLLKVLKTYPDDHNNSLILSNLATIQRNQGKYDDALRNYTYAINMTPNATTLLKNRASLYLELDSIEYAKNDYERIILIDEKDEEARFYHGILAIRMNDMESAKKDFDYILYCNPSSGLGKQGLAYWYKENEFYIDAVKCYNEIIKQHPSAILLSNRAECYLALKKLNDATDDIRKAIEMEPNDAYLYILRAKLNKARYNMEDFERDLTIADSLGIDRDTSHEIINKGK